MSRNIYKKYLEIGEIFGRLEIISVDESSKYDKNGNPITQSGWKYICRCSCENKTIKSIAKKHLLSGATISCGCYRKEHSAEKAIKTNPIEDCGDYIKIFFFNKDHGYCVVDKEDYWKVKDYCWIYHFDKSDISSPCAYARIRGGGGKNIKMHQIILPVEEGYVSDHIDGNRLNNRKSNLRKATYVQNCMNKQKRTDNKSGVTGVTLQKGKWVAKMVYKGEVVLHKRFKDKEDAIKARKEAEIQYHKEFCYDSKVRGE